MTEINPTTNVYKWLNPKKEDKDKESVLSAACKVLKGGYNIEVKTNLISCSGKDYSFFHSLEHPSYIAHFTDTDGESLGTKSVHCTTYGKGTSLFDAVRDLFKRNNNETLVGDNGKTYPAPKIDLAG